MIPNITLPNQNKSICARSAKLLITRHRPFRLVEIRHYKEISNINQMSTMIKK